MPSLQSQVSMRHTEKCCIKTTHVRALNAAVHRQGGYLPVTENQKAHVSDLSKSCHQHHCISWKKHLKSCTLTNYSLSYGMIFLTNCMNNLVTQLQYETKKMVLINQCSARTWSESDDVFITSVVILGYFKLTRNVWLVMISSWTNEIYRNNIVNGTLSKITSASTVLQRHQVSLQIPSYSFQQLLWNKNKQLQLME